MLTHHIQKSIVYKLAFADSASFTELKPTEIENKLYTYHLKQTMSAGLVIKLEDGAYALTAKGKRVAAGVNKSLGEVLSMARSVLLVVVTCNDKWLIGERLTHPLIGMSGFISLMPSADMDVLETVATELKDRLSMQAKDTKVCGSGYFRTFDQDGSLESFIHLTVIHVVVDSQELTANDMTTSYQWAAQADFTGMAMMPGVDLIANGIRSGSHFFFDETYHLGAVDKP